MKNGPKRGHVNKTKSFSGTGALGAVNSMRNSANASWTDSIKLMDLKSDETLFESLQPLSSIAGKKAKYHLKPGAHPDFANISGDNVLNHYITSMFIGIKKSTNLFKKYEPIFAIWEKTVLEKSGY